MKIPEDEQTAVRAVVLAGSQYGYGNMISHLQSAWARELIEAYGMNPDSAKIVARGGGYPIRMHEDLMLRGEYDETGERYREASDE